MAQCKYCPGNWGKRGKMTSKFLFIFGTRSENESCLFIYLQTGNICLKILGNQKRPPIFLEGHSGYTLEKHEDNLETPNASGHLKFDKEHLQYNIVPFHTSQECKKSF